MSYHSSSVFSLDIRMDVTITNFLNEGHVHSTRASHRNAACSFSKFLKFNLTFIYLIIKVILCQISKKFSCGDLYEILIHSSKLPWYSNQNFVIFVKFDQTYPTTSTTKKMILQFI